MKSQLLQSCQGCAPSICKPHPNLEAPSQPSPRGRSTTQPPQTQQEGTPAPWGGAFGGHGEGLPQAAATLTELPGVRTIHHRSHSPTTAPAQSEAPSQPSPRGRNSTPTSLNSAGMSSRPLGRAGEGPPVELPPLGEGMGRGFRRAWEGLLLAAVFVPAKAGLFERP